MPKDYVKIVFSDPVKPEHKNMSLSEFNASYKS